MAKSVRVAALVLLSPAVLAAQSRSGDDAAAAAGILGCLGCGAVALAIPLILLIVQIVLLVWVARDAKARGMDNAVLWMLLVFFVPVIGVVVYMFSRPQGKLTKCATCSNKRLEVAAKCPHCGN